jgi:nitroimidazol reductase NimA-like FMN-containing flavoprotein (pyridoxamine 5'-phosphate oxidase superfamily)
MIYFGLCARALKHREVKVTREYHMRRKEKEVTDQDELTRVLTEGKYTTVAMCRENEPYLVTLSYGLDSAEMTLYFHCAQEGHKIDFIEMNPEVCGTVIEDRGYRIGECEQGYCSVVYRGRMSIVDEMDAKKHGLEVLLNHLEDDPSPLRAKYFDNEEALRKVCVLKLSISEVTGKQS